MSLPLPADLAVALAAESTLAAAVDLRYFPEVDSTNDVALALAGAGAGDGLAVLAGTQRAGRGRRGRVWLSPPDAGIYLSFVARRIEAAAIGVLTLAAGVAAARAARAVTGLPVQLKWPNDLVIGRPWRKLAGILCESIGGGPVLDAVVVGLGVNLRDAAYPPDLRGRATSIETELGRPIDRAPVVVACLRELSARIGQLRRGDHASILAEWRGLGVGLDRAVVRWHDHGGEHSGRTHGIDDDGALLVVEEGRVERIIAGEVTWDPMS